MDLGSTDLSSEADDEEIVEMGDGFSFFAKLLRINWPFGRRGISSFLSLFSSA